MSGIRNGLAKRIIDYEPRAVYTHCYGHALNLACSDAIKNCKVIRNSLGTCYEIVKLIKKSPRREAIFRKLKRQITEDSPGIRVLCPTRWTVRAESIESIISNYETLHELWVESLMITRDTEMKNRIQGISSSMHSFDFFYGLVLGKVLLKHSDNLSKTLQSQEISAAEGQKLAEMTILTIQSIRSDANFDLFWQKVTGLGKELEINDPVLPRKRKRPRRFTNDTEEEIFPSSVKDFYQIVYFDALDLIITGIRSRIDQPGYAVYSKLEDLIVKAENKEDIEQEIKYVIEFYKDDFNESQLRIHLDILSNNIPSNSTPYNLSFIVHYLRSLTESQRSLMSQVCILITLIIVMPATNSTSERSFSSLRRIKSYLRSTMTQTRLNSAMILNIHKELTDQLDLAEIVKEFVRESHHRENFFGKFC